MVQAALGRVPQLDPGTIDDLMLGCASPAGVSGYNMSPVVAVLAGMNHLPGTTVNRYGSSSLQTTRMALHAIKAGEGDVFISAGVETVSQFDKGSADFLPDTRNSAIAAAVARTEEFAAGGQIWSDPAEQGALPDYYIAMGQTAENVAQMTAVTRDEEDAFAVRSQNLTEKANVDGFWLKDIAPVTLADGTVVTRDDGPRSGVTMEGVAALKPIFRPDGTVTAGNACPLNDGAAALVITSDRKARELAITPLARIISTGVSGLSPEIMGLGPVEASRQALARAGMSIEDIDLVEINEAFAAQVIPSARQLGIDEDKLNVNGGTIALGHPFGMTGARITSTLINSLQAPRQAVRPGDHMRRRRPEHGHGSRAAGADRAVAVSRRLEGKMAIVTGASRGIGLAVARRLVDAGARVVITARKQEALDEAAAGLGGPEHALAVVGRADDSDHQAETVQRAISAFGGVDLLVNNSGINPLHRPTRRDRPRCRTKGRRGQLHRCTGPDSGRASGLDAGTWRRCRQHVLRCGTGASRRAGAYGTSKVTLNYLMALLAVELGPAVRVDGVAPAAVKTSFATPLYEGRAAEVAATYPLKRLGQPSDIGSVVAFLLSEDAAGMTGRVLVVNGGVTLSRPPWTEPTGGHSTATRQEK
jgi:acetyl-CoA C-acetyltransferase